MGAECAIGVTRTCRPGNALCQWTPNRCRGSVSAASLLETAVISLFSGPRREKRLPGGMRVRSHAATQVAIRFSMRNGRSRPVASTLTSLDTLGLIRHRQLAHARACRRIDRVGHCRRDRRGSGLAHPSRRLDAVHNVYLDCRRLVQPQHRVIVEIALLDAAIFQRDLTTECRRDAEDDPALDL